MQRSVWGKFDSDKVSADKCGVKHHVGLHALGRSAGSSSRNSPTEVYSCQLSSADSAYTEVDEVSDRLQSPCRDALHATTVAPGYSGLLKPARPKSRTAAFGAVAQARRKAIKAMRLIAIAQHLAEVEASDAAVSPSVHSSRQRQPEDRKRSKGPKSKNACNKECAEEHKSGASQSLLQCHLARVAEQAGSAGPIADHLKALVGVRISVLRDTGQALQSFCKGRVTKLDDKGLCVDYDNGPQEWLQLEQQNFRLLGPRAPSAGLTPAMQAAMLSTPAVNRADSRATPLLPQCRVPPGQSAIGGRISIFFPGDGNQHAGWVLAYNRPTGRHHVLYDDGEDEWISLAADASSWESASDQRPHHGGLPPNSEPPAGLAAVGYNVAVYWKEDAVFYSARVTAFEQSSGTHLVAYKGGGCESLCLREESVKWLHQPQASTVRLLPDTALLSWLPSACSLMSPECEAARIAATPSRQGFLSFCGQAATRSGCDSPALLTPLIGPGSRAGSAWEMPITSRRASEAFDTPVIDSLQQPLADGCTQMQCHPHATFPSQAPAKAQKTRYDSAKLAHELQRPVSMPLLRSSFSDDDICGPMVPCGGFVPRSQSDPGPQLLSEDARTNNPFASTYWSGMIDASVSQLDSLQGPSNSLYCELNPAVNCLIDDWAPSSSAMAVGRPDTDNHLDDLLQSFTAGAN